MLIIRTPSGTAGISGKGSYHCRIRTRNTVVPYCRSAIVCISDGSVVVQHGNSKWKKMKERVIILQEGKEIIRTFDGYYRRQSMKIIAIPANL